MTTQQTKQDRARVLRRCRRPALASMEYSSIVDELWEISSACQDIHYFYDDERTLLDAFDGDTEAENEFQVAFALLDEKSQRPDTRTRTARVGRSVW